MAVAFARSGEVFDVRPLGPVLIDWETAAPLETGAARERTAGQRLHVQGEQSHSVLGIEDASLLMTIVVPRGSVP